MLGQAEEMVLENALRYEPDAFWRFQAVYYVSNVKY